MPKPRALALHVPHLLVVLITLPTTALAFASDEPKAPGAGNKVRRHAVFHVENTTSDLTIKYRVRWGTADWGEEVALKAGEWYNHQWAYDPSVTTSIPTPEIRFATGINRVRNWTSYGLATYDSAEPFKNGKRYSFVKNTDDSGEDYVDLAKWSRAEENAYPYYLQGATEYRKGQYAPAIENLDKAIKAYPDHAEAFNFRGLAYFQTLEHDRAIADFTESIRLKPRFYLPYNNRGYAWINKQEYDKAIEDFNEALRYNPKYAFSYCGRGNAYAGKQAYDKAIVDLTRAIQLNPKYEAAYNIRGVAYLKKGDATHALADVNEAIRLNPKYAFAYSNRAAAYFMKADYDAVIENSTKAIELNPKFGRPYWWRSKAFLVKGQDASAKADYDEALRLDPSLERHMESVTSRYQQPATVNRVDAITALKAFKLGSTLTPQRLLELNNLPNIEPLDKPADPIPDQVLQLIKAERTKHAALEQEMVAAADKLLSAATQTPEQRKALGLRLQWLYGPVTSPLKRENSVDDLGGLRIVGHLELPDGRQINMIFPLTYRASSSVDNTKGGPTILWGGDNCRVEAQLFSTGEVRSDFAYQSFSIDTEKNAMEPKIYIDEKNGTLINRYITSKALGTSCMDCHANGPNLKKDDLQLMKEGNFTAMRGYAKFLDQAEHLGANRPELRELKKSMAENPASLLPLEKFRKANEDYWVERYADFARKQRQ